jgi:hypothetical protein
MKYLLRYTLSWISQNLSVPFWTIGHIHLMTTIYADIHEILMSLGMNWSYPLDDNSDIHEILMSLGMNLIVAAGFIADFIDYRKDKLNNK